MSETNFSFSSTNQYGYGIRRRGNRCWCELESLLMTSWTYDNFGRRFHGCGNFKVMRKKVCNYFQWFDEDMSRCAKDVIRSLKDKNEELMDVIKDIKKNEDLLKMKIMFMYYFVGLSMMFVFLIVFALVATHVLKLCNVKCCNFFGVYVFANEVVSNVAMVVYVSRRVMVVYVRFSKVYNST
ncbi:unnamed protein product [Lathyrus sativus]|nr:unnamed protein product [Lathyrus sativus]